MVQSDRRGRIRTRELEDEALKNDWTIEINREGEGLQVPGWIIRWAKQRLKNKRYEIIGAAKTAHRKSRWKLLTSKNNRAIEINQGELREK